MQVRLAIGVGQRHGLVELDAEAGPGGREHVAVLPADRLLQQRCVDSVPAPDPLEDEEVRRAHRELDVRGADDRPAVEVRGDLGVVALRHAGDLLGLEQAADAAEVHLQDRRGAGLEHAGELVLGREPLAGRDRDRGRAGDARHLLGRLRRRRLLEPERLEALEPPRQADGAGDRELPVRAEQQVAARADGLADLPEVALAAVEVGERRLPRVEGRVRPGGIELERREAERGVVGGALSRPGRGRCRHRSHRLARRRGSCRRAGGRARARRATRAPASRPPCRRCPTSPSRCPRGRPPAWGPGAAHSRTRRRRARSPRCGTARARRRGGRRRPRSCPRRGAARRSRRRPRPGPPGPRPSRA